MQIISWIISTLLQWYVWMPIVAVLMFLTWRNYRKIEDFTPVESVLLVLEIPRTNDKQELAAEQLFASLHGILQNIGNDICYSSAAVAPAGKRVNTAAD